MKIVYKIYSSCISKEPEISCGHVTPLRTPDFKTEAEAEELLAIICGEMEETEETPFQKQNHCHYFIQKTYIQE